MFNFFKQKQRQEPAPSGPAGHRAYIIGDVHGCLHPLQHLLRTIETHDAAQKPAKTRIVFLGDLIDRGAHSREVIDFIASYTTGFADLVFLMGNHAEIFLKILDGNSALIDAWFGFGGRDCARSYGVDNLGQVNIDPAPLLHRLQRNVPQNHLDFIASFKDYHVFGDFLCVHAGIRPKTKLENQKPEDLRWIRSSFLNYMKKHPYIVVHGHTIVEDPTHFGNRIAIDTGVAKGGKLTAVCIDMDTTHFISVEA